MRFLDIVDNGLCLPAWSDFLALASGSFAQMAAIPPVVASKLPLFDGSVYAVMAVSPIDATCPFPAAKTGTPAIGGRDGLLRPVQFSRPLFSSAPKVKYLEPERFGGTLEDDLFTVYANPDGSLLLGGSTLSPSIEGVPNPAGAGLAIFTASLNFNNAGKPYPRNKGFTHLYSATSATSFGHMAHSAVGSVVVGTMSCAGTFVSPCVAGDKNNGILVIFNTNGSEIHREQQLVTTDTSYRAVGL